MSEKSDLFRKWLAPKAARKHGEIWRNMEKYGEIWRNMEKPRETAACNYVEKTAEQA